MFERSSDFFMLKVLHSALAVRTLLGRSFVLGCLWAGQAVMTISEHTGGFLEK